MLDVLFRRLRSIEAPPDGKTVHIVVGPAGVGKSYLFSSLFSRLHAQFMEDKARQEPSRRPLPLLPEYLAQSEAPVIRSLLRAFLQTEFARPLESETFEWMMGNGLGMWLIDGLDEIIAQDITFFEYILDLLTRPQSPQAPVILICLRDSLLATNDSLREFIEQCEDFVAIYRLNKWTIDEKRYFAALELTDRADDFISTIQSTNPLRELSTTPYYCRLLADQYRAGQFRDPVSERDVLSQALTGIIDREYEKKLIDRDVIQPGEVMEFLESLAAEDLERNFRGISRDTLRGTSGVGPPGRVD